MDNKDLFKAILFEDCLGKPEILGPVDRMDPPEISCENVKNKWLHCFAESPTVSSSHIHNPTIKLLGTPSQINSGPLYTKVASEALCNVSGPVISPDSDTASPDSFYSCSPMSSTFGIADLFSQPVVSIENFPPPPVVTNTSPTVDSFLSETEHSMSCSLSNLALSNSIMLHSRSLSASSIPRLCYDSHHHTLSSLSLPRVFTHSPPRSISSVPHSPNLLSRSHTSSSNSISHNIDDDPISFASSSRSCWLPHTPVESLSRSQSYSNSDFSCDYLSNSDSLSNVDSSEHSYLSWSSTGSH